MSLHVAGDYLPYLVMVGQALVVALVVGFLWERNRLLGAIRSWSARHALGLSFVVALVAMLGSLYYSEVVEFIPCKLCWYQRIFLYPQVVILGLALLKRSREVFDYSRVLALISGAIAAFHYYVQLTNSEILPCGTVGQTVACNTLYINEFSYMTIPLMSLTASLMILLLLTAGKNRY